MGESCKNLLPNWCNINKLPVLSCKNLARSVAAVERKKDQSLSHYTVVLKKNNNKQTKKCSHSSGLDSKTVLFSDLVFSLWCNGLNLRIRPYLHIVKFYERHFTFSKKLQNMWGNLYQRPDNWVFSPRTTKYMLKMTDVFYTWIHNPVHREEERTVCQCQIRCSWYLCEES